MRNADPFDDWLTEQSYLKGKALAKLPRWRQNIAVIKRVFETHMFDGMGTLYYNDPQDIEPVANALQDIGETELSQLVLHIASSMAQILRKGRNAAQTEVVEKIREEPTRTLVERLDEVFDARWHDILAKLKALAEANDWRACL